MRCIIDEAESWRGSNPELVLPDAAEALAASKMEGIASAAVHAAKTLSEFFSPWPTFFFPWPTFFLMAKDGIERVGRVWWGLWRDRGGLTANRFWEEMPAVRTGPARLI